MTKAQGERISIWLMPASQEIAWLQRLITVLANRYDAPVFRPHVTIFSGEYSPDIAPADLIERGARDTCPFSLFIRKVGHSAQFTRTLYFALHDAAVLTELSGRVATLISRHSQYVLQPHLSLLYKHMSPRERARCAAAIQIDHAEIRFDALEAIQAPAVTANRHHVQSWKTFARASLAGFATDE